MPKSTQVVLVVGILAIIIVSLFTFHITDIFLPAKQPEPANNTKIMDTTTGALGLKIEDTQAGTGAAVKSGDTIVIHYLGTLTNGTKFDSSYDRGQPLETQIDTGAVIKGWDLGVIGMKVGGKRKLTIPPDLGYGQQGAGDIPPNSTLIFEVELLGIK